MEAMAAAAPAPLVLDRSLETMEHTQYCNGTALSLHGGGTWRGHFGPGVVFLVWGLWWAFHAARVHLRSRFSGQGSYSSQAWYHAALPGWFWLAEPALKAFGSPFGILTELRFDHPHFL